MKGKMKVLSLLLAAAMSTMMFAGCNDGSKPAASTDGGDASTTPSTTESKTESTGGAAANGEVTEINWYVWANPVPPMADKVIPELNKKTEADIGIKVNFQWATNQDSMRTAFSSGDKNIDVAFACNWWCAYPDSAQRGYFADITDKLPEVAPELYNKLPSVLWEGMKVGDRIYGVPTWKDSAAQVFWTGRQDILEGAGAVEDFNNAGYLCSTLTPVLEKVKDWHDQDPANNKYSEGLEYPYNINKDGLNPHASDWDLQVADVGVGVRIKPGNTTVAWYFDDADYIANMKTMKDWADRGLSNGKVAPQVEQEPTVLNVGSSQGWDGAQYTAWGGPTKGYSTLISDRDGPYLTTNYVQGGANVIGVGSKKVDAGLKYLQYINTNEEYRNMLAYGVEGVTFTTEKKGDYTVVDTSLGGNGWSTANFTIGTMDILWPTKDLPDDLLNVNQKLCEATNTASASELIGFNINTENIQTEIAACTSIYKEFAGNIKCGAVNDVDASIASFKDKMMAQGLQNIIDECQKQVDEFLAAKK